MPISRPYHFKYLSITSNITLRLSSINFTWSILEYLAPSVTRIHSTFIEGSHFMTYILLYHYRQTLIVALLQCCVCLNNILLRTMVVMIPTLEQMMHLGISKAGLLIQIFHLLLFLQNVIDDVTHKLSLLTTKLASSSFNQFFFFCFNVWEMVHRYFVAFR